MVCFYYSTFFCFKWFGEKMKNEKWNQNSWKQNEEISDVLFLKKHLFLVLSKGKRRMKNNKCF